MKSAPFKMFFALITTIVLALACSANTTDEQLGTTEAAATLADVSTYFHKVYVGGANPWVVKKVNGGNFQCANGQNKSQCPVTSFDLTSSTGLNATDISRHNGTDWIYRGSLASNGVFTATEVWGAPYIDSADFKPFYRVINNGATRAVDKLNVSSSTITITTITGESRLGINNPVILLAGTPSGSTFAATYMFTKVLHWDPTACTSDSECVATGYTGEINMEEQCYCPTCPVTAWNATEASTNETHWGWFCGPSSDNPISCDPLTCDPPPAVACVSGHCQVL